MLVGRSSSGAGLAGCCSSYWSEAGSGGGTRELHSRRNKMAQTETTAINVFFFAFAFIKGGFTRTI